MSRPVTLLFDNAARPDGRKLRFSNPLAEICAHTAMEVPGALDAMDSAIARGKWVAGYLSYELGYALEPRIAEMMPAGHGPLIRMFVFDGPQTGETPQSGTAPAARSRAAADQWPDYQRAFARAHRYIVDGDIYQVNLTFPLTYTIEGRPEDLYASLRGQARAGASALLQLSDEDILSFSPETFFTLNERRIVTRPMKGTASRGLTAAQDLMAKRALRADPKERAENLMIVDLLRNDLSRVAAPGSVRVTDLFTVETFPRLHTMTSGVAADLRDDVTLSDILRAIFPCGSITGAPKIRAMEIIRELEPPARGPYCGAIGFAGPGVAAFNVAIRTLTIRNGIGVMPVGSGVVADSKAETEYAECLLKARFLNSHEPDYALIETMAWTRGGGVALQAAHDERLAESAATLGFAYDPMATAAVVDAATARYGAARARIRLLLRRDGGLSAEASPLEAQTADTMWRFEIADAPVASHDRFQHHKTTRRAHYDAALAQARARGLDEVIFLNERGEIVEGCISTVFVDDGAKLATPPLGAGALNGCLRRAARDAGLPIVERTLSVEDLRTAQTIWLGNSVRGFVRAAPAPGAYSAATRR